jgi:hypothetical protein
MKTLFLTFFLISSAAIAGERVVAVVCPPNLSYCYKVSKPLLPRMNEHDEFRVIQQEMAEARRNIENKSSDNLDYELSWSYFLRGR